jgi:rare lipoprotein A
MKSIEKPVTVILRLPSRAAVPLLVTALLVLVFPRSNGIEPKCPVRMVASYYGSGFHGQLAANGTRFDKEALTAAHRTLPFGTLLHLTNPMTRKSVIVEVTDRGPYCEFEGVHYYEGARDLDVSESAARKLGFEEEGIATLLVERLPSKHHQNGRQQSVRTANARCPSMGLMASSVPHP